MENKDFVVFILSHGRADKVVTYNCLKKQGYTGKIYFVLDDEDKAIPNYRNKYGDDQIKIFSKDKVSEGWDSFDNFKGRGAVVYARNACFDIAEELGVKYFLQLDDDYTQFIYRILNKGKICTKKVLNLDELFKKMIDFYKSTDAKSIAFAQGGDFIGGMASNIAKGRLFTFNPRKAMNTFFCSTERRFQFIGKINEDVNTYVHYQSKGNLFLTVGSVSINQKATQSNSGGMTDFYLDSGTYIKSFYTVLCAPDCTKVKIMHTTNKRLHHSIDWKYAVPVIISDRWRKR